LGGKSIPREKRLKWAQERTSQVRREGRGCPEREKTSFDSILKKSSGLREKNKSRRSGKYSVHTVLTSGKEERGNGTWRRRVPFL